MTIWLFIVVVVLAVEGIAILTREKYFPTFSRMMWRLLKLEDNSYDRNEVIVRVIYTIALVILFGWIIIHLAWGPCALGIC